MQGNHLEDNVGGPGGSAEEPNLDKDGVQVLHAGIHDNGNGESLFPRRWTRTS